MSDLDAILRRLAALEEFARRPRAEVPIEGTYAPTYDGGTTPGTTTYGVQVGAYVRLDALVLYTAYVTWTNATGTGTARIGLPFTPRNTANLRATCSIYTTSVTFTGSGVEGLIVPNDAHIYLYSPISNALRADVAVEAAGEVVVNGWLLL